MEYPVFKAECVLAFRGARDAHGNAGVALAGLATTGLFGIGLVALLKLLVSQRFEFQAIQVGQGGADIGMVADLTGFDPLDDQRLDRFLDLLAVAEIEHRLDHALAGRLLRTDPSSAGIPVITERIEIGLRPRRRGVERAVSIEFHARNEKVQFHVAHMLMAHPEDIRLIPLQPCEGGFFEIDHHSRLLYFGGIVVSMEGHHAAGVTPFPAIAVDQGAGEVGVA